MQDATTNNIPSDNCLSVKIFEKARKLFFSIGIRNTTMDELAKEIGISKKTLYKEFQNKADIVHFCVEHELKNEDIALQEIFLKTDNAIEELLFTAERIHAELKQFHPSITQDLMKFYPESWALIEHHRDITAKANIVDNLKKGIKQGLYRKNINVEMVAMLQLHLSFFPFHFDGKTLQPSEIYAEILRYNLFAIATPTGIEQFEKFIKKINL